VSRAIDQTDQATLPVFRLLLVVQLIASAFFGLFLLLAPATFAALFGFGGDALLAYRLGGAATFGYAVAALVALRRQPSWAELRIPMVATLTFNVAAALAAAVALLVAGGPIALPTFVLVAATAFSLVAAYWLRRNQGPSSIGSAELSRTAVAILVLATLSAAVFGVLPLVVPGLFANLFGLVATDLYLYRVAGAATLGYATAGWLEIRARRLEPISVQNLAAIAFNALAAAASLTSLLKGDGGLLAPLVLVAAGFFAVALSLIQLRVIR
jgi:hypothetical protein